MKGQYKRMHFARDNTADKISGFHKLKTKTAANTSRKLFHTSWKKKKSIFLVEMTSTEVTNDWSES